MQSHQNLILQSEHSVLTAREAAERLSCAPDYVGKLCREGKLTCVWSNNQWHTDEQSVFEFEKQRQFNKAVRRRVLAEERKIENNRYKHRDRAALRTSLLIMGASICFGLLFIAANAFVGVHRERAVALSAALGQLDSPFFGTYTKSAGELSERKSSWWSNLFSGDVRVQVSLRTPSALPSAHTPEDDLVDAFAPTAPMPAQETGTSAPQIVIHPVVQHTVERVVVENGISSAMLSSIVRELAQGSDGAIQYSKGGSLSASSSLSWDNAAGELTIDGLLRAGSFCIEDTCLTKTELETLLRATHD